MYGGRQWRSRNIVAKHMRQQLLRKRIDSPAPSLLGSLCTAENDGQQILCEEFVELMGNMGEDQGQSDGAHVQGNGQGGVVETNGCTAKNEVQGKLETIGYWSNKSMHRTR